MSSIRAKISGCLPVGLKYSIRSYARRAAHFGFRRYCPACGSNTRKFAPWGEPARDDAVCPICLAKEPHRLAALFFDQHREHFKPAGTFLHVAPEKSLAPKLRKLCRASGMQYVSGDIRTPEPDRIDICNLRFADQSIDIVYACHVMMALPDDMPAFAEVFRVLKAGGVAILQVYASPEGETFEPKNPQERATNPFLAADLDVYRIYSDADYGHRLESVGFTVERFRENSVRRRHVDRMKVTGEILHIATKPLRNS